MQKFQKIFKICLLRHKLFFLSALLFLMGMLQACAKDEIAIQHEVIKVEIPAFLTMPTPHPIGPINTNEDLVELLLEYREALNSCNNDKVKIGEL